VALQEKWPGFDERKTDDLLAPPAPQASAEQKQDNPSLAERLPLFSGHELE
jgi:hypothetical protein